jgi:predicted enzyme related to lactoylglutathione lyase
LAARPRRPGVSVGRKKASRGGSSCPGTPSGTPAAWSVYFAVDNTDVAVAAAVEHGSVVQPIRDSPYGRIDVVTDNQGAVFSLITSPQS